MAAPLGWWNVDDGDINYNISCPKLKWLMVVINGFQPSIVINGFKLLITINGGEWIRMISYRD